MLWSRNETSACYGLGMRPEHFTPHYLYLSNLHKVREVGLEVLSLQCMVQPLLPLQPVLIVGILDTSWTNQRLKLFVEFP